MPNAGYMRNVRINEELEKLILKWSVEVSN